MSIDAFSMLGISDRDNITDRELKLAYAAKLKLIDVDQDLNGFIALRQAFEQARSEISAPRYFREIRTAPDIPIEKDIETPKPIPEEMASFQEVTATRAEAPAKRAMRDVEALVADPGKWHKLDNWLAILDGDHLQAIDDLHEFEMRLRSFFCQQSGFGEQIRPLATPWMMRRLLDLLDERFGWTRNNGSNFWDRQQLDWLRSLIDPETAPMYRMSFITPLAPEPQGHAAQQATEDEGKRRWYAHPALQLLWAGGWILLALKFTGWFDLVGSFTNP